MLRIVATAPDCRVMTRTRRTLQKLERLESLPAVVAPSLEEAFAEIENLDARHPSARETTFGAIIHPARHGNRSTLAQDGQ
jgi:hypothetical protein